MPDKYGTGLQYDECNVYHNTMQIARYQPVGKATELAKQCNFWYLLEQCSSTISSSAVWMRSALGVENFHAAITFATQSTSNFRKDITKSLANDVNRARQAKCQTRRCSNTRNEKMTTFHFREIYFTSYVESDVSKRFSRQSCSDLPLRSCLYDAPISSYLRSKFRTL